MIDREQRILLGAFIRGRREAMAPDGGGRRRTPGLRREELAARAGISATWCAWLEQGREVRPSPHALSRLARALGLTRAERAYLFELAGRHDPELPEPSRTGAVPPSLAAAVRMLPCPAYGLDHLWNVCAWNEAAEHLFDGWLGEGRETNLLSFLFLDPRSTRLIPDHEARALRILAEFRSDFGRNRHEPAMTQLVDRLLEGSALFRRDWDRQGVLGREGGEREFIDPEGRVLSFIQHTFTPADSPDHKLVVLVPTN